MTKNINIPLGKKKEKKFMTINIGSNSFDIAVDEKSIEKLSIECEIIGKELEEATIESMEEAKTLIKKGFNVILGKGSFKKVYEESGSVVECTEVLMEVAKGITANFKTSQQEKAMQLAKKKASK